MCRYYVVFADFVLLFNVPSIFRTTILKQSLKNDYSLNIK